MIERTLSDEYLVFLTRQNNQEAHRELFCRYQVFLFSQIKKVSSILKSLRIDPMILRVELLECVYSALDSYDFSCGFFYSFWRLIYKQHLKCVVQREFKFVTRDEQMLQLDEEVDYGQDHNISAHELVSVDSFNNRMLSMEREIYERVSDSGNNVVSEDERIVLLHYSEGANLSEIARSLHVPLHKVRKNFQKGLSKLRLLFKD